METSCIMIVLGVVTSSGGREQVGVAIPAIPRTEWPCVEAALQWADAVQRVSGVVRSARTARGTVPRPAFVSRGHSYTGLTDGRQRSVHCRSKGAWGFSLNPFVMEMEKVHFCPWLLSTAVTLKQYYCFLAFILASTLRLGSSVAILWKVLLPCYDASLSCSWWLACNRPLSSPFW